MRINNIETHQELLADLQSDTSGFAKLADILMRHSGIYMPVNEKNLALMATRLIQVIKKMNCSGYTEYAKILARGDVRLLNEFTECLTTNKTDFFREARHFEVLKSQLERMLAQNLDAGRKELRIWCAASSTGQEPYSIGMTLLDSIPEIHKWSIKFLASDIDTSVLKTAASGTYTERELEGLSPEQIEEYLHEHPQKAGSFQMNDSLRNLITFAQFNLMTNPFPFEHRFDIIFCRNVLIYFDRETATSVIERLSAALRPGGILFVGHTETGIPKPEYMEQVAIAAYQSHRSF